MNNNDYIIRLETRADYAEIENLTREAFWNVYRPGCEEHLVLHNYRNNSDFIPELSLCMEKDVKIIGHVMYSKADIKADDGRIIHIMTFGPISILPEYKRKGYGKKLLDYSLKKAAELGAGAICIEGNIDFYGKSGFIIASTKGIYLEGESRENDAPYFLLKELHSGFFDGITGVFVEPKGYSVNDDELEKFDAAFPKKEKLKLPGQLV